MKKIGSVCDYINDRDKELYHRYREALATAQTIKLDDILLSVIHSRTSRLWLSENRAAEIIKSFLRADGKFKPNPKRAEIYSEVWRRYRRPRGNRPNDAFSDIVFDVVNSPADSFYLTIGSAKVIICKIRCRLRKLK